MHCFSDFCLFLFTITVLNPSFAGNDDHTKNHVALSKALIISHSESWGCLNAQQLLEDITAAVAAEDDRFAMIQEIKNREDIVRHNEMYLVFPANQICGLNGYLVLKLGCSSDGPHEQAYFQLEFAKLYQNTDRIWNFSLRGRGNGSLHARLLYSQTPEIRKAMWSCREAGESELAPVTFFNAYPVNGRFDEIPLQLLNDKWQMLELKLHPYFLEGSAHIDRCQGLLYILDGHFAVEGDFLIWKRARISSESLRKIALSAGKSGGKNEYQIMLKIDDRTQINTASYNFSPHIRQKLALRNDDGSLTGAELWLRVD